jgi:hypothetical protein
MSEFKRVSKAFLYQSPCFQVGFGTSLMVGSLLFLFVQPPSHILTVVLCAMGICTLLFVANIDCGKSEKRLVKSRLLVIE